MIMEFIEILKSSNLVWLILSLCSIISVPLAIYFGRKSLSQKIIYAVLSSNELITNNQSNIPKLKILYDNEAVNDVTVTRLTFWNQTVATINKTDIIDAEPLSIFINNGKILDASVLKGGQSSNKIKVFLTSDNSANITFDYLDKKEGGIIQVIHTGSRNSIDITRKIKGGKVKVNKFSYVPVKIFLPVSCILCVILLCFDNYMPNEISIIICVAMEVFSIISLVFMLKILSKDHVPKNCKKEASDLN